MYLFEDGGFEITEQNLADQVRRIRKKEIITRVECEEIERKLKEENRPATAEDTLSEKEKIDKYQELKLEIMRMWSVKAWVVQIVVGALGCTTKKLGEYLKNIGHSRINSSLQMSALLGTANILRKTLDV